MEKFVIATTEILNHWIKLHSDAQYWAEDTLDTWINSGESVSYFLREYKEGKAKFLGVDLISSDQFMELIFELFKDDYPYECNECGATNLNVGDICCDQTIEEWDEYSFMEMYYAWIIEDDENVKRILVEIFNDFHYPILATYSNFEEPMEMCKFWLKKINESETPLEKIENCVKTMSLCHTDGLVFQDYSNKNTQGFNEADFMSIRENGIESYYTREEFLSYLEVQQ